MITQGTSCARNASRNSRSCAGATNHSRFPAYGVPSAAYALLEILFNESQKKDPADAVKRALREFVQNRYAEDLKAKDLAAAAFCSVPQVFRYTKKYFGLTPAHYINGIRLQQAEILLLNTKKTVTEIAYEVGFLDSAYFSKLFKKFYAESPLSYRMKNAENH